MVAFSDVCISHKLGFGQISMWSVHDQFTAVIGLATSGKALILESIKHLPNPGPSQGHMSSLCRCLGPSREGQVALKLGV